MLNKDICIKCRRKTSNEYKHKSQEFLALNENPSNLAKQKYYSTFAEKNYVMSGMYKWNNTAEKQWRFQKHILCPATKLGVETINITSNPPNACPYLLEHLLKCSETPQG
jgi:hypothetical protein